MLLVFHPFLVSRQPGARSRKEVRFTLTWGESDSSYGWTFFSTWFLRSVCVYSCTVFKLFHLPFYCTNRSVLQYKVNKWFLFQNETIASSSSITDSCVCRAVWCLVLCPCPLRLKPVGCGEMCMCSRWACSLWCFLTRDSAVCVWCNRGSGSRDKWMHSGIFIVPPSRSAMMTSNWWARVTRQTDKHLLRGRITASSWVQKPPRLWAIFGFKHQ